MAGMAVSHSWTRLPSSAESIPLARSSCCHVRNARTGPQAKASSNWRIHSTAIVGSSSFGCFAQRGAAEEEQRELKFERLFSNLNQVTFKGDPGSLSSAVFLVAGTTVGAGILAIPAVTQESGFLASAVNCIVCWVFMVATGLLIAEVNVNTMCELGSGGVSLVSMDWRTLGTVGVQVACWSYFFIHYVLLIAYVARSSDILTNFLGFPLWESATLFSLVTGGICYFRSKCLIGGVNGILEFGIIISFAALVVVADRDLHWEALVKPNIAAAPPSIPVIALSVVYQTMVPVLCTNLEGDLLKVWSAIVWGTAILLGLFLIWNAVILGLSQQLIWTRRNSWILYSSCTIPIVEVFSLFVIATSFIRFVLGLSDFLSDLLKVPLGKNKPLPYLLTLVLPLILSLLDPEIFFKASDFVGTYGVLVLFGILPATMSWSDRYFDFPMSSLRIPELVPGGKVASHSSAGPEGG